MVLQIAYNGRFLASPHPTGTHRSALAFLRALNARGDSATVTLFGPPAGDSFDRLEDCHQMIRRDVRSMARGYWHIWEQVRWPFIASRLAINPLNTGPFLPFTARQIIFAHDLNVLRSPANYTRAFRWWYKWASIRALKRALHIVCFSKFVRDDLVARLGLPSSRISVIPQGPGLPIKRPGVPILIKERYFLCVGGMQPHKNLKGCLEAWLKSQLAECGYILKIVGKPQSNYAPLGIADALLGQKGIEFTGYVSDASLIEMYKHAMGFIYPSLEEGFGLPVIEAFYLGAAVITSNCSCLPEVAGNAALLVDPLDISAMCAALLRLANDHELRNQLIAEGTRRAAIFSWDRAGDQLIETLRDLESRAAARS
jgi:glycosyltransferase involved in cell wall biosynthesis